jgi:hypothetical protein
MWALLSTRLRTWLLLAIALPVARMLVHRLAASAQARWPDAPSSTVLCRVDEMLTRLSSRAGRKRPFRYPTR